MYTIQWLLFQIMTWNHQLRPFLATTGPHFDQFVQQRGNLVFSPYNECFLKFEWKLWYIATKLKITILCIYRVNLAQDYNLNDPWYFISTVVIVLVKNDLAWYTYSSICKCCKITHISGAFWIIFHWTMTYITTNTVKILPNIVLSPDEYFPLI